MFIVDSVILIYQRVSSVMSSRFTFLIHSMIRGYHVYKDIWTDPDYDEELECVREPGNSSDPYAVAVKREISGDSVMFLDRYLQYVRYL